MLICLIIGLATPGCAWWGGLHKAEAPPQWVNQPTSNSKAGFLHAVGSGESRESAIDAALLRLAQTIEVRIVGEESTSTSAVRHENNHQVNNTLRAMIDREIHLFVDQRLPGVNIEEVYFDRDSATHYALVSLDRVKTAMQLDGEAMESARLARLALNASASIDEPWARLQQLDEAEQALDKATDRQRASNAVSGGGASGGGLLQLGSLRDDIARARADVRSSLRIAVSAVNGEGVELADAVRRALISHGLVVARGEPTLFLRCSVTISPVRSFDQRTAAAQWSARIELVDARQRVMIDTLSLTGSVVSRNDSRSAALRAATQRAVEELPKFLSLALNE